MGLQNWKQRSETLVIFAFQILTIVLLSLLLPLSFLLLARLSCAHFLLNVTSKKPSSPHSFLLSFFLYTNYSALLYSLVSLISVATLIHALTGKTTFISESPPGRVHRPRLYAAWILLCTLQVCVGLGIEGSIEAGVEGSNIGVKRGLLSRVIFFLGLHEIMLLWCRTVVKPVVDDTIFGLCGAERWAERVAIAMSFGTLWWWKLREEVESLVVVAEVKKELGMGIGVGDFVGWWLYYLAVTIGMVRLVKGMMWFGLILLCQRVDNNNSNNNNSINHPIADFEDKV